MASRTTPKTASLSSVVTRVAEKKGIDTTKAGKSVRSYLRRHYPTLEESGYDGLSKVKTAANDGNRWPDMPAKFANEIVKTL